MARGWESKAVEGQIESRRADRDARKIRVAQTQLDVVRKREDLQLSRRRVLNDIQTAHNPRYKQMLTAALEHLDKELAGL